MANEIKEEFKTYVQNITETICKEIYLEDLKALCNQYTEQLENCKGLYERHIDGDKNLQSDLEKSLKNLSEIRDALGKGLSDIEERMNSFADDYDKILREYSTHVNEINTEMREEFIKKFTTSIDFSRIQLKKELDLCNENISKSLEASLTGKDLEAFIEQMSKSTKVISEGLELINGGYEEIFKEYSDKVGAYGDKEQQRFHDIVENTTREGIEHFRECIDETIKEQKTMIEERVASHEEVDQLKKEISGLNSKIEKMQKSYEEKLSLMIKILEKEGKVKLRIEHDRRIEKKYLFTLVVANIVLMFFAGITLLSVQPWIVLGNVPTTILLVCLLAVVLYMLLFRVKKALPFNTKKMGNEKDEGELK